MKVLISYPTKIENEVSLINELMTSGEWDVFHLRKPDWSETDVIKFFGKLKSEVRSKTVLHHNFNGSCHSFKEVEMLDGIKEYCFLSPIFDSISKQSYKAKFDKNELKDFLQKERKIKVIALGGVSEENYAELLEMGFNGGAFLGSIWKQYV
ncbi:MAG: thiamine phosphate synthase [Flavobacteriales bacterium]